MSRLAATAVACVSLLCRAEAVRAQAAHDESAIVGTVADATGAVIRDAAVVVSGASMIGGPRAVLTDRNGAYRVLLLPPGVYDVTVKSPAFAAARRTGVALPANTTLTVDVRLDVGSVRTEVDVRAESPMLDVRSSASPVVLDESLLQHLPTDRVLADLLNLAPGVFKAYAPGTPDNVAFGGTQGSNAVLVDGIRATEPETGAMRLAPNYNWIEQAQIVAIGAGPEYGRTTGAILDATIRSGSNRFSGLAEYRVTASQWVGRNTSSAAFTPRSIRTSWDADAQMGGPVRADRIWFFGGLAYSRLVDRPAGLSGPDYTDSRNPNWIGKIDAALSSAVRVEGLFSMDRQRIANGFLSTSYPTSAVAQRVRQSNAIGSGRLRWVCDSRTTVEVQASGYSSPHVSGSQLPDGDAGPPPRNESSTGAFSNNTSGFARRDRHVAQLRGSVTHFADRFLGTHEFTLGADFERTTTTDVDGIPGGRLYYDYGHVPYVVEIYDGSDVHASGKQTSFSAQDVWRVRRVTLDIGIRLDANRGSVPGAGTVFSTTPVSPRIGVVWDVSADHRTVVKAHYGSLADPLYTNLYGFKDATHQSPTIIAHVDAPGQFTELEREEPYNASIARGISPPHVVQAFAGIEREVIANAAIEVRYINRRFKDFIGNIDTGSIWASVTMTDPGPDNKLGTSDDGASLALYKLTNPGQRELLVTNPSAAFRRYDAFQITGRKRYSHGWQALGGYTWTRTTGTVSSGGTFANAFLDRFDFAWYGPFADPNRLVNKDAAFTSSEVKVAATYRFPRLGGANVSAIFRAVSGAPVRRIVAFRGLIAGTEPVLVEPTISSFLDPQRTLDLRVEKTFGTRRGALGMYVDVFNVTNQGIATSIAAQSGPRFGAPLTWSDPRMARAGLRWTF